MFSKPKESNPWHIGGAPCLVGTDTAGISFCGTPNKLVTGNFYPNYVPSVKLLAPGLLVLAFGLLGIQLEGTI